MRGMPRTFAVLLLCMLWAASAPAQPLESPGVAGLSWDSVGRAAVDGSPGGYSVSTLGARVDFWRFSLTYDYSDYHWHGVDALDMGDHVRPPWDQLQTLELSFRALDAKAGSWRFRVDPVVQSSFESEPSGSLALGAKGVVTWDIGKGWGIYFPYTLLAFSAHGSPSLVLDIAVGLDFPESSLSAMLTKWGAPAWLTHSIDLRLEFGSLEQFYHLDDDNPLDPDGILWVDESVIALIMLIMPSDQLIISLGPEYHMSRNVSLDLPMAGGDSCWDVDSAWGFSLRIGWKF